MEQATTDSPPRKRAPRTDADRARDAARYAANREKMKAQQRARYAADREALAAKERERYRSKSEEEKEEIAARHKEHYQENREARLLAQKGYKRSKPDPERNAAKSRAWRAKNRERHRAELKKWREENPAKASALDIRRKNSIKQATPLWADFDAMNSFYELAKMLTELTGEEWQVDHVVPIQGRLVCGLHVQDNLQVITAKENLAKSNRFPI